MLKILTTLCCSTRSATVGATYVVPQIGPYDGKTPSYHRLRHTKMITAPFSSPPSHCLSLEPSKGTLALHCDRSFLQCRQCWIAPSLLAAICLAGSTWTDHKSSSPSSRVPEFHHSVQYRVALLLAMGRLRRGEFQSSNIASSTESLFYSRRVKLRCQYLFEYLRLDFGCYWGD